MDGLDQTIESHRHGIFAFAYCLLGNRAEAEDVTQEVLVRLWRNHARLDRTRIKAWLTSVTRNACIDVLRRRNRDPAALHALSEPYRSIVVLREIQDMSYDEIARALDLPLNTVKVYLHRGRRGLSQAQSGDVVELSTRLLVSTLDDSTIQQRPRYVLLARCR